MKERWSDLDANLQAALLGAFSSCIVSRGEEEQRNDQFFLNIIWSLSVLGFHWYATAEVGSKETNKSIGMHVRAYMEKLLNDPTGINGIAVATVFDSLAKLECSYASIDKSLVKSLEAAAISCGMDFSPRELATTIYSMGKMGG